jgi:hypothetical protein
MSMIGLHGSPLSQQQARLWSWQHNKLLCPILCAIQIQGSLQRARFVSALESVTQRHEILRTVFYTLPGMDIPVQVVADDQRWEETEINLDDLENDQQLTIIDAFFLSLQTDPDDLHQGPPVQIWLVRLAADRCMLIVRLPALCADSHSLDLFVHELANAYTQEELTEDVLQYADVAAWQEDVVQAEEAEGERAYWRKIDLSLVPSLRLPFER